MGIGESSDRRSLDRGPTAAAPPHASDRIVVADAVAQLSSHNRGVLRRAYYHGWTTAQIAADLGIAEASVKTELHYALRTLQQTLRDMGVAL